MVVVGGDSVIRSLERENGPRLPLMSPEHVARGKVC